MEVDRLRFQEGDDRKELEGAIVERYGQDGDDESDMYDGEDGAS